MPSWARKVPHEALVEGEHYFLAVMHGLTFRMVGRGLNGKALLTVKPGIAIHAKYDDKMRAYLDNNPEYFAVAIPGDYATRWTARKKPYRARAA